MSSHPAPTSLRRLAVFAVVAAAAAISACSGTDASGSITLKDHVTTSDGGSSAADSRRDERLSTASSIPVTDEAWAPVTITGEPLDEMVDRGTDPAVGQPAPVVSGTSLGGAPISIEPGQPTVLYFLAHWCPHCQAEVPRVVKDFVDGAMPEGVRVIAVVTAVDPDRGNFPPGPWLAKEEWPFETLLDSEQMDVLRAYGIAGFPGVVAIDAAGNIAARSSGELDRTDRAAMFHAALGAVSD